MAYEATPNAAGVGTTTQVVVGIFNNATDAHQAVTQLRANGFSSRQIGAAFRSQSKYSDTTRTTTGAVKHDAENWWEKVKDAFRSDDKVETRKEALPIRLSTPALMVMQRPTSMPIPIRIPILTRATSTNMTTSAMISRVPLPKQVSLPIARPN